MGAPTVSPGAAAGAHERDEDFLLAEAGRAPFGGVYDVVAYREVCLALRSAPNFVGTTGGTLKRTQLLECRDKNTDQLACNALD